jgi:hypothetical protein
MFSCDYNGWADVPEEEREAIDAYEVEQPAPAIRSLGELVVKRLLPSAQERSQRRAA